MPELEIPLTSRKCDTCGAQATVFHRDMVDVTRGLRDTDLFRVFHPGPWHCFCSEHDPDRPLTPPPAGLG